MQYRKLGRSGISVSPLCLGTMQFGWTADESASFEVLSAAFEAGINFIDTADMYSRWAAGNPGGVSETIIGRWMQMRGIPREQLVIATKVRGRMGEGANDEGLSRRHIMHAVQASLRRLQTDYIDLYQVHWPDEHTPIEETLTALTDLVRRGDVRYLGCSNFSAWQIVEALWTSDRRSLERFISLQPHYNLVHRDEFEGDMEAVCLKYGLGVMPYSPLAGGYLTGKYQPGVEPGPGSRGASSRRIQRMLEDPQTQGLLERLLRAAAQLDKTPSQVALAWVSGRPSITSPIIGPKNHAQLEDNLRSLDLSLTPAARALIEGER